MARGWYAVAPPAEGTNSIVAKKAIAALIGQMPMVGTVSIQLKKALFAAAGIAPFVGTMSIAGKKANLNVIGTQGQSGLIAISAKKAKVEISQDLVIGTATITAAKAIAALTSSQVMYGDMTIMLSKAQANFLGIQSVSGVLTLNANKAIMAAAGAQSQIGVMSIVGKKAIFAAAGTGPLAPTFDKASTYVFGTSNQATWDVSCVLTGVAAGATIVVLLDVPGAGGVFDINNSNYSFTVTSTNGTPTWTKRTTGSTNNGSTNGGLLIFTAQNVNAGNHTIRVQQTANVGSWVSIPQLCAISVVGVTSIINRETRGIYPGPNAPETFSAPITLGANSLGVVGTGSDIAQITGIVNGTSRVAGGANNTGAYYVTDWSQIITVPGPSKTVSATASNQYLTWCAIELVA